MDGEDCAPVEVPEKREKGKVVKWSTAAGTGLSKITRKDEPENLADKGNGCFHFGTVFTFPSNDYLINTRFMNAYCTFYFVALRETGLRLGLGSWSLETGESGYVLA